MEIWQFLQEFNTVSVILRLTMATILGGLIGLERGVHGQAAGLRTFALVSIGAALSVITGEYLMLRYQMGDPARLAAQVISGIGFLGVGTIIVTGKNYVKGLTTAASLWATACMGIAIGSGYLIGAFAGFCFLFFVMTVMTRMSRYIDEHSTIIKLYLELDKTEGIGTLYEYVADKGYEIQSIDKQKRQSLQGKDVVVIVVMDLKRKLDHSQCIKELHENDKIHYIEEIR